LATKLQFYEDKNKQFLQFYEDKITAILQFYEDNAQKFTTATPRRQQSTPILP
jgi:hypothetical protein